jgi:hypothetical protein
LISINTAGADGGLADRAGLAVAHNGGGGQDDGQHGHVADEAHDAVEPG